MNIDISLDAPERREGTAAPASRTAPSHRTQPKRDVSPRPAVRPQQRTGHDVLPEPYRKYYASVMKKPYYPVAVPLRQPEPPAPRAASYDVAEVWGAPPAQPAFVLPDLRPTRRMGKTLAAQAEPLTGAPEAHAAEPVPIVQAEPQAAPDTEAMPAAQAEPQAAAPDMRTEAMPPAAQARDGGGEDPPAPPHDIWELLEHLHPQPSGRPAPLLRVDSTEQIEELEPPQPDPEDNAEDEARAAAEREQARALGELLERAQAALPQPGEAPLKRAFQAETAQEPQAGSQPPQDMQAEAVPAQGGAAPGDGAEREALGRTIPPEERSHYVYVENDDWDEDGFFTDWDVEQPIADEEDAAEADDGTETDGEAAQPQAGASAEPAPVFDAQPVAAEPVRPEPRPFSPPPSSLLEYSPEPDMESVEEELNANGEKLIETLQSFGVRATMLEACRGPAVTRYELQPAAGVKISKITNLSDDIAMNLAATGVRIEAPIPGKAAVGIEVPNRKVSTVRMRELVESPAFRRAESPLTTVLGRDIAGELVLADLAKMPHLLIAGSTGSGKSVCINAMIVSLLYKSRPEDVRFLMIDPKVVELGVYNGIPQLIVPVVTDPRKAAGALGWAVTEMLRRYQLFAANNVRDLSSYNRLAQERGYVAESGARMEHMPRIVIIIDELADLMMAAPNEVEDSICRLAQMARAAGMHLVIATQRPSVDVITGIIKANIPSRIAFAVSSQVDSRTILDMGGAEKLLGRGDMLFSPLGVQKPVRVQGCFIDDREIEAVVDCIRGTASSEYDENVMEEIERGAAPEQEGENAAPEGDVMIPEAVRCVVEAGQASTSLLQRRLRLGYARAGRLIDEMEQMGVVGPHEGSKPRQVLITWQQYLEMAQSRGWEH